MCPGRFTIRSTSGFWRRLAPRRRALRLRLAMTYPPDPQLRSGAPSTRFRFLEEPRYYAQ